LATLVIFNMQKLFFISLLFLPATMHGQTDSTQKGWAVTLTSSLIPLGPSALGIQPGAEYTFNDRLNLLTEITSRATPRNRESLQDRHDMRFKSELRYNFFKKRKRIHHEYTGLQIASAVRRFTDLNGYYYENAHTDTVIFFDKARLNSPVTTLSLQFGSIIADGRLGADLFMGFGVRLVHTTINDVVNPRKGTVHPRAFYFPAAYNYAGNVTQFHFNAGIRFMWHFYDFQHPRKR